jgi:hypothetical protein
MITSRKKRWTGYVAECRRKGLYTGFGWKSQKERNNLEDLQICGCIILK